MFLPGLVYFIVFKYVPMAGIVVAFQDYNFVQGILGSDWVGFRHFERLLADPMFARVLRNTVLISLYRLALEFPAPIVFALLLNELRKSVFKRWVQTISYLPHFISWVVIAGLLNVFFRRAMASSTGRCSLPGSSRSFLWRRRNGSCRS